VKMKSNTNEIRRQISSLIRDAADVQPFYINRPSNVAYPYILYEYKEINSVDGQTSGTLEVDIVTKDKKTVNDMADQIQDAFDHNVVNTDKLMFHSYRARRYPVVEEDKSIQRIHLQMDMYVYSKEEESNA